MRTYEKACSHEQAFFHWFLVFGLRYWASVWRALDLPNHRYHPDRGYRRSCPFKQGSDTSKLEYDRRLRRDIWPLLRTSDEQYTNERRPNSQIVFRTRQDDTTRPTVERSCAAGGTIFAITFVNTILNPSQNRAGVGRFRNRVRMKRNPKANDR